MSTIQSVQSGPGGEVVQPRRRLMRTALHLPRKVSRFWQPLSPYDSDIKPVSEEELAHFGRVDVLEQALLVLHRDGTTSARIREASYMHGDEQLKRWEEISVVYRRNERRPKVIRSVLSLPNGHKHRASIVDRAIDQLGNRAVTVRHTHLRPGVMIDHEFTDDFFRINPSGIPLHGEFWMRTLVPCRRRHLTIAVAEPFKLHFRMCHGAPPPTISTMAGYTVHRWDARDCDGVEADEWTPPATRFCPMIEYSTVTSWRPLVNYYLREMDPAFVKGQRSWNEAHQVVARASTPREKVRAAYKFAAREVRYGRPTHQQFQRTIRSGTEMATDLRGDCKDKAALMTALLRSQKITANVVVLRTNALGQDLEFPAPRFDHAISLVELDGEELWLDPASGSYTFNELPFEDQGAQAIVLRGDGSKIELRHTPAARPVDHSSTRQTTARLDVDGNVHVSTSVTYTGDSSAVMRFRLKDRNADARRRVLEMMQADVVEGAQVESATASDVDDLLSNVTTTCTFALPLHARPLRDLLLMRLPWSSAATLGGPLLATKREVPLLWPHTYRGRETIELLLPEGFSAYALPVEFDERCTWGSYRCTIRQEGQRVLAERQLEYATPGAIIQPDEYPIFREFVAKCVRADSLDLVLYRGTTPIGGSELSR